MDIRLKLQLPSPPGFYMSYHYASSDAGLRVEHTISEWKRQIILSILKYIKSKVGGITPKVLQIGNNAVERNNPNL